MQSSLRHPEEMLPSRNSMLGHSSHLPHWKYLFQPFLLLMQQCPCEAWGSLTLGRARLLLLGCFLQDSCAIFGVIFILSLTIWLFQIIFLSVSFNIMSSKLESDVPQMAFSVSYLYICRRMPRFLTLNKAIFHLLFWFLGERTGVLFVQTQQYRNMQQCWAWALGCLLLCLPRLLL